MAYCMEIAAGAAADLFCGFSGVPVSGHGLATEEVNGRARASSREVKATPWHDGAHELGGLNE